MENNINTQVAEQDVNETTLEIKLINKNGNSWWNDIQASIDGQEYKVIGCSLDVISNYDLTQSLLSYYSYVEYYNNLVITINNKPLSLAHLKVLNFENILKDMENIETMALIFKTKIKELELKIISDIRSYVKEGKIVLEKKTLGNKLNKALKNIFKWKRDDSHANAVQISVSNNLVGYNS